MPKIQTTVPPICAAPCLCVVVLTADVVNSILTAVSVDVAYVCTQPIVAVDVAALVVVSVRAPEPPPIVTSPVSVEAPVA